MGSVAGRGCPSAPCRGFRSRRAPGLLAVAAATATVATTPAAPIATTTTATVAPAIPLGPTFRLINPDRPPVQFLPIQRPNQCLWVVGFHGEEAKAARASRVPIRNNLRVHHVPVRGGQIRQVHIADTPHAFVGAVAAALDEDGAARETRIRHEAGLLGQYAWDRIAREMDALITDRLQRKHAR